MSLTFGILLFVGLLVLIVVVFVLLILSANKMEPPQR